MITPQINDLLKRLEKPILEGQLTKANYVDEGTFICAVSNTPAGMAYNQFFFDQIPNESKPLLLNKKVGEIVDSVKIVAIFDVWID